MKSVDVTSGSYIKYNVNSNDKDPKFLVGGHVRIWKYKNIFAKGYTPNWSGEIFVTKKLKIQFRGHILLMTLKVKDLSKHFMKKNSKNQIKKN